MLVFTQMIGHDVIAQAQSGTGKTATFAISVLQKIDVSNKVVQALILAPTRELAQQVCCCCVMWFAYPVDPKGCACVGRLHGS